MVQSRLAGSLREIKMSLRKIKKYSRKLLSKNEKQNVRVMLRYKQLKVAQSPSEALNTHYSDMVDVHISPYFYPVPRTPDPILIFK